MTHTGAREATHREIAEAVFAHGATLARKWMNRQISRAQAG